MQESGLPVRTSRSGLPVWNGRPSKTGSDRREFGAVGLSAGERHGISGKGGAATDTVSLEKKLREDSFFDEAAVLESRTPEIHLLINQYITDKNLSHADIIRMLNVERSYGYQILNGKRTPTREQMIRLGLIFRLTLPELQRFLKAAGKPALYARNMADARVIYAVEHGFDYDRACEFAMEKV